MEAYHSSYYLLSNEPVREKTNNLGSDRKPTIWVPIENQQFGFRSKTNNLGSDQVQHKPGCTVTEDRGWKF